MQASSKRFRREVAFQSRAPGILGDAEKPTGIADQLDRIAEAGDQGEGQREISSDVINARQPQPHDGFGPALSGWQREAPDRRFEPSRLPFLAELVAARRQHALDPGMPRIDKSARQTDTHEIASRRDLAVEPDRGIPPPREGRAVGYMFGH